jgi:hypothetical protein
MTTEAPIQETTTSEIVPAGKGLLINRNFALLATSDSLFP